MPINVEDISQTKYEQLMLCAYCLCNYNASLPVRVGRHNKGIAKDLEGRRIKLPSGAITLWEPDAWVEAGGTLLAELALVFGHSASFVTANGYTLPMFAVATFDGTTLCGSHLADMHLKLATRRGVRGRAW